MQGNDIIKVTRSDIKSEIKSVHYLNGRKALEALGVELDVQDATSTAAITICIITCHNNHTFIGTSTTMDIRTYNEALGKRISRRNATSELIKALAFKKRTE